MQEWLRALRKDKKFTQEEVARKASVTKQFYSYIENGKRRPSPEVAKRIAATLGFSTMWYRLLEPTPSES